MVQRSLGTIDEKMASIRQNEGAAGGAASSAGMARPAAQAMPDWRNLGVMLRVLVGVNAGALLAAMIQDSNLGDWLNRYVEMAAWVEPLLLACLGLLALGRDLFWRLPLRTGQGLVVATAMLLAMLQYRFWHEAGLVDNGAFGALRAGLLAGAPVVIGLVYFQLRGRGLSPAAVEARLIALNARIRPHFLFNSINAVLSLIRQEPRRAEAALESLAELFRAALRDPREFLPLSDEIALGRQYLELERLRLGDRLRVKWEMADVPLDMSLPPLMLQPLLENAVYHGIEPAPDGGEIRIAFARQGRELAITVANAKAPGAGHGGGNRIALENIRERLALYYDLEARLEVDDRPEDYQVRITLPCQTPMLLSPS